MRILFLSNHMRSRCGIAEYGRHHVDALRALGHEVREVHATYDTIPPPYYPPSVAHFHWDVVHLNWHPITLGHVQWEHVEPLKTKLYSCFFHESAPEWQDPKVKHMSLPPLWKDMERPDCVRWSSEPMEGAIFFRMPAWDVDVSDVPVEEDITIGWSGIRGDGLGRVEELCGERGWKLSKSSTVWLPPDVEVRRLARCWLNVAHYHGGYTGQASVMGPYLAAERPILISSNRMLKTWVEFAPKHLYLDDLLEHGVSRIIDDLQDGIEIRPTKLKEEFSWPRMAASMVEEWERRML